MQTSIIFTVAFFAVAFLAIVFVMSYIKAERDIEAAKAAGLRAGILFAGGNLLETVKVHCKEGET